MREERRVLSAAAACSGHPRGARPREDVATRGTHGGSHAWFRVPAARRRYETYAEAGSAKSWLLICRRPRSQPLAAAPADRRSRAEVPRGENRPGRMAQSSWIQKCHRFIADFCIDLTVSSEPASTDSSALTNGRCAAPHGPRNRHHFPTGIASVVPWLVVSRPPSYSGGPMICQPQAADRPVCSTHTCKVAVPFGGGYARHARLLRFRT